MAKHVEDRAIRIKQKDAALYAARLSVGQQVQLPAAPFVHVYVARGQITLEGAGRLEEGDAVRITASEGQRVTSSGEAEVLVWEMHAAAM
jgi:redox-sensitive bicupin YhaK (pirin superfamily)